MTDVPLPYFPRRVSLPLRLILDHNPFYLMSAVSMLLGCFALLHALQPHPGQIGKLILLIGTLHIYEFLLLFLAIFLVHRRGLRRDGRILLIIQSIFLADATFLTAEIFTANIMIGAYAAAVIWILAAVKVAIVARFSAPLARPLWAMTALTLLGLLYVIPGILARTAQHNGSLDRVIYIAWWLTAAVVMLGAFARRIPSDLSLPYLVAPLVSLIAHLLMANWVYHVDFHAANLAPILIAAAVVLSRNWPAKLGYDVQRAMIATLPMLAVCCSLSAPASLERLTTHADLSALRLTLFIASAIFTLFSLMHGRIYLPLAVLHFIAGVLGSSPENIINRSTGIGSTAVKGTISFFPTTAIGWGWTAVVGAFLLLGAGAMTSLRRPPPRIDVGSE